MFLTPTMKDICATISAKCEANVVAFELRNHGRRVVNPGSNFAWSTGWGRDHNPTHAVDMYSQVFAILIALQVLDAMQNRVLSVNNSETSFVPCMCIKRFLLRHPNPDPNPNRKHGRSLLAERRAIAALEREP